MKHGTSSKIKDHTDALEKIYRQRRMWLYASSIVYTSIILVIFSWDYLIKYASNELWWVAISLGLIVSVNWWYWTMKSIAEIVRSMYAEYEILNEITIEISEIKTIVNKKSKK